MGLFQNIFYAAAVEVRFWWYSHNAHLYELGLNGFDSDVNNDAFLSYFKA